MSAYDPSTQSGEVVVASSLGAALDEFRAKIPSVQGEKGDTGNGIASVEVRYQRSDDGTSIPSGSWFGSPQATSAEYPYLWTRTTYTLDDGQTVCAYSVGVRGADGAGGRDGQPGTNGRGIASSSVSYQRSADTSVPSGTWYTTPSAAGGLTASYPYMWTRTVTAYTDGTSSTAYSVGMRGADGSSASIATPITVGNGGTGATYASQARKNLGATSRRTIDCGPTYSDFTTEHHSFEYTEFPANKWTQLSMNVHKDGWIPIGVVSIHPGLTSTALWVQYWALGVSPFESDQKVYLTICNTGSTAASASPGVTVLYINENLLDK